MAIQETATSIHWNYFLALEKEAITISRYIEFTKENSSVFSMELLKLLFSSSSEIDVVMKLVCKKINKTSKASNISHYKTVFMKAYPEFSSVDVVLPRYGLTLRPWLNWKNNKRPDWWAAYNNVKHERNKYYNEANLINTLNPEILLIGGDHIAYNTRLMEFIRERVKKDELHTPILAVRIQNAGLKDVAGVLGSVGLVLDDIFYSDQLNLDRYRAIFRQN